MQKCLKSEMFSIITESMSTKISKFIEEQNGLDRIISLE